MTITYPRELYSDRLAICTMELTDPTSISRTGGGKLVSVVDYGDPFWLLTAQTSPVESPERRGWLAWKNSLRGGLKSFLAYDTSRKNPAAYPNGIPQVIGGTWDGEGTVSSITARQIVAGGAPTGLVMSPGDLVGLVEDGRYGLFEVQEEATAGASTITLAVEPAIPLTIFSEAATVVFHRPKAEFVLLQDTWSDEGGISASPIGFDAVQKL